MAQAKAEKTWPNSAQNQPEDKAGGDDHSKWSDAMSYFISRYIVADDPNPSDEDLDEARYEDHDNKTLGFYLLLAPFGVAIWIVNITAWHAGKA